MCLKKSIFTFITAGLISTSSFAVTEIFSSPWGAVSEGAGIVYSPDYSDSGMILTAEVSHSSEGEQRVYFYLTYSDDSNICTYENKYPDDETFVFAAGDIGVEYNFDIPLQLALDFRPELGFGDYRDDIDFDIALGIKYQF